jgi:predicted nucleotidyltransferase
MNENTAGRLPSEVSPPTDPLLAEIVGRLIAAYAPERVYLFGSAARGEAAADSDFDLLLIVPDDAPVELQGSRRAYEALWGLEASTDVLVWTRSAFDRRLHLRASLPATVLREGRLLHAA